MSENIFGKYRARLVREGLLKAFLLSGSIGLGVLSLTVLLSWFFGFKAGLWLGLGLFAACVGAITPLIYIKRYRPTELAIARRVDALGLEERMLTMVEYDGESSYMAECQRQDAMKALGSVNAMLVTVAVSAALIAVFCVGLALGASSVTVGALYAADVIPDGISLVRKEPLPGTFTLTYSVSNNGGGTIVMYTDDWENEQSVSEEIIVTEGEDAPAVLAVSDETHIFIGWSDGSTEVYRQDRNVRSDLKVEAIFLKISESVEAPEEDRMTPPNIYREPSDRDNENNNEFDPDAPPWQTPPSESTSDGQEDDGMDGDWKPGAQTQGAESNQIIDGQTFYGDTYEDSHNSAMDRLGSDDTLSEERKDSVSKYYDAIEQDSSQDEDGEDGEDDGD